MRPTRTTILAGAAALLTAATAVAATAETKTMEVPLPDGSTIQVRYVGDVAPTVTVQRAAPRVISFRPAFAPFAELDRMAAEMQARHHAMMQQMAAMQRGAARTGGVDPRHLTSAGGTGMPAGVQYTMVSSTTDANGCTRRVEVRSDGSGAEPRRSEVSSGTCDTVEPEAAPQPAEQETRQVPPNSA